MIAGQLPKVYEFSDFRLYLDECIKAILLESPKLGQRPLNKLFGFSSPNFIQNVIKNKKNISEKTASSICKRLDLNKSESEYFVNLVNYNQSVTMEEKLRHQSLLMRSKGFIKYKNVESMQYQYFSNWAMIALREMCTLPGFSEDTKFLKNVFKDEFTSEQLKEFMSSLKNLRLIGQNLEGKWFRHDEDISMPPGLASGFIYEFHKMMIERSAAALFSQPSKERDFSTVSISFDQSKVEEVRGFLENVRSEFIAKFGTPDTGNSVYTLNMQLFCLASLVTKPNS